MNQNLFQISTTTNTTRMEKPASARVARSRQQRSGEKFKAQQKASRARRSEWMRQWAASNPEKVRNYRLKAVYGITTSDYDKLLESQGNVCAICKRPEVRKASNSEATCRLAVDHDHVSGKLRGLLCMKCNTALAQFDTPEKIASLKRYLECFQ
jgi:hypothetical protein